MRYACNYTPPGHKTFSEAAHRVYQDALAVKMLKLATTVNVCFSHDVMTCDATGVPFLSVTATYVSFPSLRWERDVIAMRPAFGEHTAAALAQHIQAVFDDLHVDRTRLGWLGPVTSDHASAAVNVAKDQFRVVSLGCIPHALNIFVDHVLEDLAPTGARRENWSDVDKIAADLCLAVSSVSDTVREFKQSAKASYGLRLATEKPAMREQVLDLMVRWTGRKKEDIREVPTKLSQRNATRWSSTYKMFNTMLILWPAVQNLYDSPPSERSNTYPPLPPSPQHKPVVEAFTQVMAPVAHLTRTLQDGGPGSFGQATLMLLELYNLYGPNVSAVATQVDAMRRLCLLQLKRWVLGPDKHFRTLQLDLDPRLVPLSTKSADGLNITYPYKAAEFDCTSPFRFGVVSAALDPRHAVHIPNAKPGWQESLGVRFQRGRRSRPLSSLPAYQPSNLQFSPSLLSQYLTSAGELDSWLPWPAGISYADASRTAGWNWVCLALTNYCVFAAHVHESRLAAAEAADPPADRAPRVSPLASGGADPAEADPLTAAAVPPDVSSTSSFSSFYASAASFSDVARVGRPASSSFSSSSSSSSSAGAPSRAAMVKALGCVVAPPLPPTAKLTAAERLKELGAGVTQRQKRTAEAIDALLHGVDMNQDRSRAKAAQDHTGIFAEVINFLSHDWKAPTEDKSLQSTTADPLEWWRTRGRLFYPTVALAAFYVLSASATSAQDERNASALGRIMDKRRARLTASKGEALIVARDHLRQQRHQLPIE